MRFRHRFSSSLLVLLSTSLFLMMLAPAEASWNPTPSQKVLRNWAPTWQLPPTTAYTSTDADVIAKSFDLVVAQPWVLAPFASAMHAANTDLSLLAYVNGMWAPDATYPATSSLWARDANGERIMWKPFKTYLLLPTSTWAESRAAMCADAATQGYDGCLLDNLGVSPITTLGDKTGAPINPSTGNLFTSREWLSGTSYVAQHVRELQPDLVVIGNGGGSAKLYFDTTASTSVLADALDGVMVEQFVRSATQAMGTYKTEKAWKMDVDMLVDAAAHGRRIIAETKLWVSGSQAQKDAWHKFALATFMLGSSGQDFFTFLQDKNPGTASTDNYWDHDRYGLPLESYVKRDGVYQRAFETGLALVNPTTSSVIVPVSGDYVTLDGTKVFNTITLAPNTGEVLQTSNCFLDVSAPTGSISIVQPAGAEPGYSSSRTVTLRLDVEDDCIPIDFELSNDGTNFPTLKPFRTNHVTWSLSSGDGPKSVWVRYQDEAGNQATYGPASIVVDTSPPHSPNPLTATYTCPSKDSHRTVHLSWSTASDANLAGYHVYKSKNGGAYKLLVTTAATVLDDTDFKSAAIDYKVSGFDRAGNEGQLSSILSVAKSQCA